MGWAKYAEDNTEIILERLAARNNALNETVVEIHKTETVTITNKIIKQASQKKEYKDKILLCKHCGKPFIFTAKDQAFYDKKGFSEPKRCKPCREYNKFLHLVS